MTWCPHNQPPLFCTVVGCPHRFVPVEERLAILEKRYDVLEKRYDILHRGRQADGDHIKALSERVAVLEMLATRAAERLDVMAGTRARKQRGRRRA